MSTVSKTRVDQQQSPQGILAPGRLASRLALAALTGVVYQLVYLTMSEGVLASHRLWAFPGSLAVYFVAICACCWPLTSYRLGFFVALAATLSFDAVRVLYNISYWGDSLAENLSLLSVVGIGADWVLAWLVISLAVFFRKRRWPVYPAGCCRKCGYNLTGVERPRCPECGTPFVPQGGEEEGASGRQ